jgi:hypothetical protein
MTGRWKAAEIDAVLLEEARVAEQHALVLDGAGDARPAWFLKSLTGAVGRRRSGRSR